jgi:hypothetical protein
MREEEIGEVGERERKFKPQKMEHFHDVVVDDALLYENCN